jgi:hypothetical protein
MCVEGQNHTMTGADVGFLSRVSNRCNSLLNSNQLANRILNKKTIILLIFVPNKKIIKIISFYILKITKTHNNR